MKKGKHLCSVLAAAVCLLLMLPLFVSAEDSLETEDGIYYEITAQNEIRITGAKDSTVELVIPDFIDGMPVTEIGDYAFLEHTRIRTVNLPDTVVLIGNYAFYRCSRLETISIPKTVQKVGWGILSETPWIQQNTDDFVIVGNQILIRYNGTSETAVIPEQVRMIAGFAFEKRMDIQAVQLPKQLESMNDYAFAGCTALKEMALPQGLTYIGTYAFYRCKQLQSIDIPDTVTYLGGHCFEHCTALQFIKLPCNLDAVHAGLFFNCTALQYIRLPESVKKIEFWAFENCSALRYIELSGNVQEVGQNAFTGCINLQQITVRNPECAIYHEESTFPEQAILFAADDSTAQDYADTYQRAFVTEPILFGDVNQDGGLMVEDAVSVLNAYARMSASIDSGLTAEQSIASDYNQDGRITVEDAVSILIYYARQSAGLCTNNS